MKRVLSLALALCLLCGWASAEMIAGMESAIAEPADQSVTAFAATGETAAPPAAETTPECPSAPAADSSSTGIDASAGMVLPETDPDPECTPAPADVPGFEAGNIAQQDNGTAVQPMPEPLPEAIETPTPEENGGEAVSAPESISLPETLLIGCGERAAHALVPGLAPENSICSFTYSSSNPRYVEVDAHTGEIYGARTGSAVITVTTDNGLSAGCKVTVKKAPSRLKLALGETSLAAGQSTAISVSFNSSSAYSRSISFSSSDEGVARVENGRAVAIAPGTAKITATAFNGKKGSTTIHVLPEPEELHFTYIPDRLGVGQTAQLSAAVNEGSRSAISFSGNDDSVALVAPDGNITALSPGEVTLTAAAFNGVSTSAAIRVLPAPESIAFAEDTIHVGVDEVLENALQLVMDENSAAGIRYSSFASRYVKVDAQSGKISGMRVGQAVIAAVAHNGATAECTVIVEKAPSRVKLSVDSKTMGVGQQQQINVSLNGRGSYTVRSSKPSVVAVGEDGMLHALNEGKAKITTTTHNGRSASLTITVAPAPSRIAAAETEVSIGVGEDKKLGFTVDKGSVAGFSFASSDPAVALVDANGKITARSAGTAIITAVTQNGLSASTRVEVLSEPEAILFDGEGMTIAVGERCAIAFSTAPEKVKTVYSYKISDSAIVRVDREGVLSGYSRGEASVTITASNGVSAVLPVHVVGYAERNEAIAVAHRGASGDCPENSIAAFEQAAVLGADMVELDVRETRDGKLVVFHDAAIEINGRERDIEDLKLSEIRKANPDVCTLEEALACIAGTDMELMIELKVSGVEKDVVECVQAAGIAGRTLYGSFKLTVINRIKKLQPGARTVYIMQKTDVLEDVLGDTQDYSFDIASLKSTLLSEETVRDLHFAGKKVLGWTLNLLDGIRSAVSMGVDGVITDYPDRV